MRRSYFRLLEGVLFSLPLLFASCGNGDNALEEIINGGGSGSGGGGSESSGTYLVYSYAIGTGISSEETQIPSDAKTDADMTNSWAGTYYIKSNKTITGDVTFTDNVKLILKDGVELTVNGCIYGGADYGTAGTYSLYVYAQSGNTGALTINSNDGFDVVVDKLEIHGGVIHASNSEQAFEPNGEFKIYNGNVTAEGTMNGIMIMNKMYVYGGTLTATSTTDPTAGGSYGISGNFTMYDGNVTTTGGDAATGTSVS